jgi:hypothetical protein
MKKPTVLLYACCVILSFAATFLLDLDAPRSWLPAAKNQVARR